MNRLWPNKIVLRSNFSNATGGSVTAEITAKIAERGIAEGKRRAAQAGLAVLQEEYNKETAAYIHYGDRNLWDRAEQHHRYRDDVVEPKMVIKQAEIAGYTRDITDINAAIKLLTDAQLAANAAALANANLTPAQRAALEKQKADLERLAIESTNKSKNKKIIIIAASIIGVIAIIGAIIYIIKKKRGAKAA